MHVGQLMSRNPKTCGANDPSSLAARITAVCEPTAPSAAAE